MMSVFSEILKMLMGFSYMDGVTNPGKYNFNRMVWREPKDAVFIWK